MLTNAVLDVAMGLILMYLMLSLLCTTINEAIANTLGLRASTLASGLQRIIDDPTLKADFFNHGLVDGAKSASGQNPSYLSGSSFAMALVGSLDPSKPFPGFSDIRDSVQHLPDTNIRDVLLTHISAAEGDVEALRNGLAVWFDHAMDRVSGVYKRRLRWIALGVGIVVALVVNADTVRVAEALWSDSSLRAEVAAVATSVADRASTDKTPIPTTTQSLTDIQADLHPFPLGWNDAPSTGNTAQGSKSETWWSRAIGLAITAMALTLGAPFWFDLLIKFVNIRGTGTKPARTEIAS